MRTSPLLKFAVIATILYVARDVLIPIALAVLLTFLLAPLVRILERAHLRRVPSVLIAVVVTTLCVAVLAWTFQSQLLDLATRLPDYKDNIVAKIDSLRTNPNSIWGEAQKAITELGQELNKATDAESEAVSAPHAPTPAEPVPIKVVEPTGGPLTHLGALIAPLIEPLLTTGIVIVFTIFMLLKREDLRNRLIRLMGQRDMQQTTLALDDAAQRVSRFLLMQTIVNGGVGVLLWIGMLLLGVPNAWIWGLFAALMRFVPYVGIWIAAAIPVLLSLAVSPGWIQPAMVVALFVLVEIVISNFVEPFLFGSGTGVSPFALLVAAVVWTWLWGGVGLLLSTPITVCLAVMGRHIPQMRVLSVLLSDEPALSPGAQLYQRLLADDPEDAAKIVEKFGEGKPAIEVYDTLILPAMHLAEIDRHSDEMDDERERNVGDALETIIEDIGAQPESAVAAQNPAQSRSVICLPARDRADELAAMILAQVLAASGIKAEAYSASALQSELLDRVATRRPPVVCISAVPPATGLPVRMLAKRLRARFPSLPIVVGLWDSKANEKVVSHGLGSAVGDRIVTTLAQAVDAIAPLALDDVPAIRASA